MTGIGCAMLGVGGSPFTGPYSGTAGTGTLGSTTTGYDAYGTGTINRTDYNGATFNYFVFISGSSSLFLQFIGSLPNSGWSTLTINGNAFNRADATYTSGSPTSWQWAAVANPFTSGSPYTAVFS